MSSVQKTSGKPLFPPIFHQNAHGNPSASSSVPHYRKPSSLINFGRLEVASPRAWAVLQPWNRGFWGHAFICLSKTCNLGGKNVEVEGCSSLWLQLASLGASLAPREKGKQLLPPRRRKNTRKGKILVIPPFPLGRSCPRAISRYFHS